MEVCVRSNVVSIVPAVTPSGNPEKVGVCVATLAAPVRGVEVGAWICEAVVVPCKLLKDIWTRMVWATLSTVTSPRPVPGEALGVTSLAPSMVAWKLRIAAWEAVAAQADMIITGDADLLTLGSHAGIPIIDAAEAIIRIGGWSGEGRRNGESGTR